MSFVLPAKSLSRWTWLPNREYHVWWWSQEITTVRLSTLCAKVTVSEPLIRHASYICHNQSQMLTALKVLSPLLRYHFHTPLTLEWRLRSLSPCISRTTDHTRFWLVSGPLAPSPNRCPSERCGRTCKSCLMHGFRVAKPATNPQLGYPNTSSWPIRP